MKAALTILAWLLFHLAAWGEETKKVPVHITGYVGKPGTYFLGEKSTPKQIVEACGGWNKTWAAPKRVVLLRLARSGNATMNLPERKEDQKFVIDLTKEDQKIKFAHGDILFIPGIEWLGR